MLLRDLLKSLAQTQVLGSDSVEIRGLAYDSRAVRQGEAFVAIKGLRFDGHDFVPDAIERGAAVVIAERKLDMPPGVTLVIVPDTRAALAALAAEFHGHPSRKLRLFGVTGTNGKTTTTYLIETILRESGIKTGVIGTLGTRIGDSPLDTKHTTPESLDLQTILSTMVESGVRAAAMEVSSHGLALRRSDYCEFDCGVFTNLTQDHLDFHTDFGTTFPPRRGCSATTQRIRGSRSPPC